MEMTLIVTEQSLSLNDLMKLIITGWLILQTRMTDTIQHAPVAKSAAPGGSSSIETCVSIKYPQFQ